MIELNDTQKAWIGFRDSDSCKCVTHYEIMIDPDTKIKTEVEKPESDLCGKERAWRKYVRLRDDVIQ